MKLLSIAVRGAIVAACFVALSSCSEDLDTSGVCAVLCPPVGGNVKNITLDAAVFDTTVQSLSGLGTENALLLASRGDTLDTRVIIRFDSLPTKFTAFGQDTSQTIASVDSAYIQLRLDTLSIKGTDPVTIEAYDVDTTANDTSSAAVLALFRPDRFISSQTYSHAQLKDTLKVFLSNAALLSKIQSSSRLRIGFRATTVSSTQLQFTSAEAGLAPFLSFRPTPDTATKALTVTPLSVTPAGESLTALHLGDYTLVAKAPPPGSPSDLDVGGLPARRVYIRFSIPDSIVDSATVVRATLLLNQIPNTSLDPTDTVRITPHLVLAGKAVTDLGKASQITAELSAEAVLVRPGDAGTVQVELARAFNLWRGQDSTLTPRAIVLTSLTEGVSP
ncbi:MAG: hypothetical protein ABR585_04325, partial [Gemmatimonadaceae bacterium]